MGLCVTLKLHITCFMDLTIFMDNSRPRRVGPKTLKMQAVALSIVSICLCSMRVSLDVYQLAVYFLRKESKSS